MRLFPLFDVSIGRVGSLNTLGHSFLAMGWFLLGEGKTWDSTMFKTMAGQKKNHGPMIGPAAAPYCEVETTPLCWEQLGNQWKHDCHNATRTEACCTGTRCTNQKHVRLCMTQSLTILEM